MWWSDRGRHSLLQHLLLVQMSGLLLLFTALFFVLDGTIDRELYQRLDSELLDRARSYAVLVAVGHEADLPRDDAPGASFDLRVLTPTAWAARHPGAAPRIGQPRYFDTVLADGAPARALALALTAAGQPRVLLLAESRERTDRLERQLQYTLLGGIVLALALAAALATLSLRRELRPLAEFSAVLRRIDPEHLPASLPQQALPQELQPLRAALDATLQRHAAALARERLLLREVAHELRTPLAEMRSEVELALRAQGDHAALHASLAGIARLQRITDSLLLLARYESGQAQPLLEPLDLAALLRAACARAAAQGAARAITVQVQAEDECWISSDPVLLERILDNLLHNAVSHAPAASRVQAHCACADAVRLVISNAAPALDPADLAQLGRRFWRKRATQAGDGHAGLGLALAQTLAAVLHTQLRFTLHDGILYAHLGPLAALHDTA